MTSILTELLTPEYQSVQWWQPTEHVIVEDPLTGCKLYVTQTMEYSHNAILSYQTVGILRKTANIAPAANVPEMEQDDIRYKTTPSSNAINRMASVCPLKLN
jgi:hypothetical protein